MGPGPNGPGKRLVAVVMESFNLASMGPGPNGPGKPPACQPAKAGVWRGTLREVPQRRLVARHKRTPQAFNFNIYSIFKEHSPCERSRLFGRQRSARPAGAKAVRQ